MSPQIPNLMHAVHLVGHGGINKLVYKTDVPVPQIGDDEVLIRVRAAGVNNTDINTRIGWYSKSVTGDTNSGGADGIDDVDADDASWSGEPLVFPRIQGADVCGHIVAVGKDVDPARIGERVLVRTMMQDPRILTGSIAGLWVLNATAGLLNIISHELVRFLRSIVTGVMWSLHLFPVRILQQKICFTVLA